MARAIDADRLADGLKLHRQPTDQKHEADRQWAVGYNAGLDRALHSIAYAPTLTQPNEPLTLDELGEMSYTDWVWLEFPREKPSDNCWERGWKAYRLYSHERYGVSWIAYRRPPEGEGNA